MGINGAADEAGQPLLDHWLGGCGRVALTTGNCAMPEAGSLRRETHRLHMMGKVEEAQACFST